MSALPLTVPIVPKDIIEVDMIGQGQFLNRIYADGRDVDYECYSSYVKSKGSKKNPIIERSVGYMLNVSPSLLRSAI